MAASANSVTDLLIQWREGDETALDRLIPLVYRELRHRAHRHMRGERQGHLLQTTALIHEAYLKLIDYRAMNWQDRAHFYAVAALAMRRILVDHARKRKNIKGGGDAVIIPLDEKTDIAQQRAADLVALDDALVDLEKIDPLKSRIVELRYFGGLTIEETADVLGIATATVERHWATAKTLLFNAISPSHPASSEKKSTKQTR